MRSWRVFAPGEHHPGDQIYLGASDSRHILKVLRLGSGDPVSLFNGQGGEWAGQISDAVDGTVSVLVGRAFTDSTEPGSTLTLIQGECRADRLEWILQKGTEIGINSFQLVRTARSEPLRWSRNKASRWGRIIQEACKQSGRRLIPELHAPVALGDLPPAGEGHHQLSILLDCSPDIAPLSAVLKDSPGTEIRILVGPESGLCDVEIELLGQSGWIRAGMGPRVLRTETAALVAAALVLDSRGDLGVIP